MARQSKKKQSIKSTTYARAEAELESRLATALTTAFPNILRELLTEQRSFTVRLGHEKHEFDSTDQWEKTSHATLPFVSSGSSDFSKVTATTTAWSHPLPGSAAVQFHSVDGVSDEVLR